MQGIFYKIFIICPSKNMLYYEWRHTKKLKTITWLLITAFYLSPIVFDWLMIMHCALDEIILFFGINKVKHLSSSKTCIFRAPCLGFLGLNLRCPCYLIIVYLPRLVYNATHVWEIGSCPELGKCNGVTSYFNRKYRGRVGPRYFHQQFYYLAW